MNGKTYTINAISESHAWRLLMQEHKECAYMDVLDIVERNELAITKR